MQCSMGECYLVDGWTVDVNLVPGWRLCVTGCPHATQESDVPAAMESARRYGDGGQYEDDVGLGEDMVVPCDVDPHHGTPSPLWVQRTVRIQ